MGMKLKKSMGIFLGIALVAGMIPGTALKARADYVATYSFDESFDGWTTIDADEDGWNWMTASQIANQQGYSFYAEQYAGCLGSFSFSDNGYISYDPDNWLISPQIRLGGSMEFDVCANNPSYPDHAGVFVSTAGNTNPADFVLVQEFYSDSAEWKHLSVDLSAYSGSGYVAIRHYNSYDQFLMFIKDVTITQPGTAPFGGPAADSEWLDPIRVKLHEQGRLIENGAESATLEISGSYALPIEFMEYLKDHPNLTLIYHVTHEEENFDVTIQGNKAIVDESIKWYGPLWLKANYNDQNEKAAGNGQNGVYVVQRGDSLMKIAQKINVTVEELVRLNHISDPNKIWAGQTLIY